MTEPKVPKLSLVKGPKTPAVKEPYKMESLSSFLKFAEDICLVEQGIQNSEIKAAHVGDLSSLKQPSTRTRALHSAKTSDKS